MMWRSNDFPYRKHFTRNKCIFIHIPKAAGTSVLAALGKTKEKGRDHVSWQVYKKASSRKFARYYKFTFVRNPYDRALSAYRYILSGGNQGKQDLAIAKEMAEYSAWPQILSATPEFPCKVLRSCHTQNSALLIVPLSRFVSLKA